EHVWADGGYAGKLIAWVSSLCQWVLEVVKRNHDVKGFKLLPKRWVVQPTFSWLSNYRRLSKHYEYWNETGEAMIHLAMIHVLLRRITKAHGEITLISIPAPVLRHETTDKIAAVTWRSAKCSACAVFLSS